MRGLDANKDQSYALWGVAQEPGARPAVLAIDMALAYIQGEKVDVSEEALALPAPVSATTTVNAETKTDALIIGGNQHFIGTTGAGLRPYSGNHRLTRNLGERLARKTCRCIARRNDDFKWLSCHRADNPCMRCSIA